MADRMQFTMDAEQSMRVLQRPSPTLVAFTQILALSTYGLQQAIHNEIESNPALDLTEADVCMHCGSDLVRGLCPECMRRDAEDERLLSAERPLGVDESFDLLSVVAAPRSLGEALLADLEAAVPESDRAIARYLVGSLDDKGFLTVTVGDVVRTLGVQPARVHRVLEVLQSIGPAGAGARDARECLLLQLQRLEAYGHTHPLARRILEQHFHELGMGQHTLIAQALKVSLEEVMGARDFIRKALRPYPIPDMGAAEPWSQPASTPYVMPDVIITRTTDGPEEFSIEVVESKRFKLRVNPMYFKLATRLRSAADDGDSISPEERHHVREWVARAHQFIGYLHERQSTLERVARATVRRQRVFLRKGIRHLKPLTRGDIAQELHLHDSTVSRAVADKYVLLPWRELMPFEGFFQAARSAQDVLKELIAAERAPLSDDKLATLLSSRGFPMARRTVAKYRKQIGILPSTLR